MTYTQVTIEMVKERVKSLMVAPVKLTAGEKGVTINLMNRHLGGDDNRRLVAAWLFSGDVLKPLSSKFLSDEQWYALFKWVNPFKNDEIGWMACGEFMQEAPIALTGALKALSALDVKLQRVFPDLPEITKHSVTNLGAIIAEITPDDTENIAMWTENDPIQPKGDKNGATN